ncbi:SDR family NAD(P)-dependent oxidoreductase [Rhizobium grahamii]|uniref:Ketoreductase n=2 Tax=Rhizobium grahamii TaxID=1120045 RepID=S3H593_9HYPH|nr:SDR family NAD(P)-dependent oxidoreductase [Rhizobium grahamii]EPE94152.1 ketoreductase [Rhizobium grahamii CCGE 502]RDJ05725.1 daunorubicin C-13 ketoreductase [Rhizobium grahamii]
MSRVFITGSTDGLGLAAARQLIANGHEVVLHARSSERAQAISGLAPKSLGVVVGDLSSGAETRSVADQVNTIGRMDAVIHNAGIYSEPARGDTPEGHPKILAVNTLAPYILTALIERPKRLVYLSSGMHQSGGGELDDIDWRRRQWNTNRAYSESKLHVAALAATVARYWPKVSSNAVDPGWVPTKMGGAGAPDDLHQGYQTQVWLATSSDEGADSSGGYWYHGEQRKPAAEVTDSDYQNTLVQTLGRLTGIKLF